MKALSVVSMTTVLLLAGSSWAAAQTCPPPGIDAPVSEQLAAIAAAETAQVIRLEDCPGTPAAEVVDALMANEAIARILEQNTVGVGEITAVGVEDGAVTIYAPAEAEE